MSSSIFDWKTKWIFRLPAVFVKIEEFQTLIALEYPDVHGTSSFFGLSMTHHASNEQLISQSIHICCETKTTLDRM